MVEANVERKLKEECETKLDDALNKNVLLVDQFLETKQGQELVRNRTLAYMQANEGLDEVHAETEVLFHCEDLIVLSFYSCRSKRKKPSS